MNIILPTVDGHGYNGRNHDSSDWYSRLLAVVQWTSNISGDGSYLE